MSYIAPIEKQFFRFKPNDAEVEALESLKAELYSDSFKVLSARYAKNGKRVVIVTDRLSASDREQGEIFSGEEYSTYENLLSYCLGKKDKAASIKEVVLFNWPFGWVADEQRNGNKAYAAYWDRLQRFIERAKPDAVVICGVEAFKYIRSAITRDYQTDHSYYINRVIPTKIAGHKFDMVGTIDVLRPCSWSGKFTKEFPNLLGYLANGIIAGMEGINRWTIDVPKPADVDIVYVDTLKKYKRFARKLRRARRISVDTEGASLARVKNTFYTFQFAWETHRGYLIPFMHPLTPFTKKEIEYIRNDLKDYFERGTSLYHIYQNGKFDITIMYSQLGVRFYNHRIYDVQAGEFALEENRKLLKNYKIKPYTLDFIAEQYGCSIYRETGFSKGDRSKVGEAKLPEVGDSIEKLRKNGFALYCIYDVLVPLHIVNKQIEQAKARKHRHFLKFVCEQLSDTIHAFSQMEATGQNIDRKHLFMLKAANGPVTEALQEQLLKFRKSKAARKVNARLLAQRGVPQGGGLFGTADTWLFDVTNTQCQQELFFKELGLKSNSPRADGKGFKVDKVFQEDNKAVAEVALFNRYKKLVTIRDTFVNGIFARMRNDPDAVFDGRIRGRYGYNDVVTGRTSVSDPNTQNIPNRGDLAKLIKRLFIASFGCLFVKNDYSAHEVRDWANEAHDSRLAKSFYVGLKMRQELRIVAYTNPDEAIAWTAHKEKHGWGEVRTAEGKQAIIDKVKDKRVRQIADAELLLEMKGDVHKNNCLAGDTLIPTDRGLVRIDSLFDDRTSDAIHPLHMRVGSITKAAPTKAWMYKGKKNVIEITTSHGNVIRCTKDHRLLVLDLVLGVLAWRAAGSCKPSDLLCINPTQQTRKTKLRLNLTAGEYRTKVKKPSAMSPDLAAFIAYVVAEGFIQKQGSTDLVQFGNSCRKVLDNYHRIVTEVFGLTLPESLRVPAGSKRVINGVATKTTKNFYSTDLCSKQVVDWLCELGLYVQSGRVDGKTGSHYKVIPWSIMQADAESQLAFLGAYLDCDGNVENTSGALRWFSASKQLASELQVMLNAHGFAPKLSKQGPVWVVLLDGLSSVNLWPKIEKYVVSKRLTIKPRRSHAGVPVEFLNRFVESRRLDKTTFADDEGKPVNVPGWRNYFNKVKCLSYSSTWAGLRPMLSNLKLISEDSHSSLSSLMKQQYAFTSIVSTRNAGTEDVYDLSMADGVAPAFIANGLIVHNCEIFYKVPVLEVTDDQRQDIKALVFGTIYGKTAAGLATTLKKTEEYAQGLQDTLFTSFPDGANWLRDVEAFGAENYYVESPLGMQRHLWGYLHTRRSVKNAMNRRGPNSIIQGVASCIGISSIRIMQKLIWNYFVKHDTPFYWRSVINYVHDSVESETQYHLIPIYLYMIEHASTTLIHRRYSKLFNYDLTVGLELEFQMGPTMDTVKKWNFMEDSLFDSIEKGMKFQKETLGYKPDFSAIDKARKNWGIIRDLRTKELQETVGSKKPGKVMLMTEANARKLGFVFK